MSAKGSGVTMRDGWIVFWNAPTWGWRYFIGFMSAFVVLDTLNHFVWWLMTVFMRLTF